MIITSNHPSLLLATSTTDSGVGVYPRFVRVDRIRYTMNMTSISHNGDSIVVSKPSTIIIGKHYTTGAKFKELELVQYTGYTNNTFNSGYSYYKSDFDASPGILNPSVLPVVIRCDNPKKNHAICIKEDNEYGSGTIQTEETGGATILVCPDDGRLDDLLVYFGATKYDAANTYDNDAQKQVYTFEQANVPLAPSTPDECRVSIYDVWNAIS